MSEEKTTEEYLKLTGMGLDREIMALYNVPVDKRDEMWCERVENTYNNRVPQFVEYLQKYDLLKTLMSEAAIIRERAKNLRAEENQRLERQKKAQASSEKMDARKRKVSAFFKAILKVLLCICIGAWIGIKYTGIGIWKGVKYTGIGAWIGIKYTGIGIWNGAENLVDLLCDEELSWMLVLLPIVPGILCIFDSTRVIAIVVGGISLLMSIIALIIYLVYEEVYKEVYKVDEALGFCVIAYLLLMVTAISVGLLFDGPARFLTICISILASTVILIGVCIVLELVCNIVNTSELLGGLSFGFGAVGIVVAIVMLFGILFGSFVSNLWIFLMLSLLASSVILDIGGITFCSVFDGDDEWIGFGSIPALIGLILLCVYGYFFFADWGGFAGLAQKIII